jgi:hypothetical protein
MRRHADTFAEQADELELGQPRNSGEFRERDARTVSVSHEPGNRLQQHPIARRKRDPGAAVTVPPG